MGKRIKSILLKLMNLVSILIILISIMALLTVVMAKPGQPPNFFGYSLFRVMTGSMEPTIPTNSLIVVRHVEADSLAQGDVITFYSRDPSLFGEPNTHRILRLEEEKGKRYFITKGDANNIEDRYPTMEEDLIGKVVFSSAFLGKLVKLISNPLIFIPLILIPLAWMVLRGLYDGITAAKNLAAEEEEAAVRDALAALREKKKAEENQEAIEDRQETTIETKSPSQTESGQQPKIHEIIPKMAGDVRSSNGINSEKWRKRYGVRQRSVKRKQLQGRRR